MPLIVEDGSGLATAQTYASVSTVTEYLTARGNATFTAATIAAREAAVLRAMRYIEGNYRLRWKGRKVDIDQALAWPRYEVQDENGYAVDAYVIPQALKDALAEAALRELTTTDSLRPDVDRTGVTRERVGPLEVEYGPGASNLPVFKVIDDLLSGLISRSGATAAVRRT